MEDLQGKCVIFSAPSGAGKTTIVRHLLEKFPSLTFSISATSRPPRDYEINGVHYYFLSSKTFKEKIDSREFLEWEEVYENRFYGTLKSEIERIWKSGAHVIFDVDVVGGTNLKKIFGNKALAIFLQPPSLQILEERLKKRSTENEETLKQRLEKASHEMTYRNKFDIVIINDDLTTACEEAVSVVGAFLEK